MQMMTEKQTTLFRKKTLDRISSPEQLTDYLRVTNPGIWAILAAVLLLLVGMLAWSAAGTLETTTDARVIVRDHTALVAASGTEEIVSGMTLRVASQSYVIASTSEDEYGRAVGVAEVTLPDGDYDGSVVTEQIRPIDFLLESR